MIELTDLEVAMLVKNARIAKNNGYSAIICKFSDFRIVSVRVELDEQREAINRLYQNKHLTVVGTSAISF